MLIQPEPTDEEAVAIAAALQVATTGGAADTPPVETPRWRFSARWWVQPIPLRRTRPW